MTLDLSHLYTTETVEIGGHFSVTIREIPHGEMVDLQRKLFGDFQATKSKFEFDQQLKNKRLDVTGFSDGKNLLAIQSWTLTDSNGEAVPVSMEAWHALPHYITEQIEEVIERLNPDLDDEFRDEPGDESES